MRRLSCCVEEIKSRITYHNFIELVMSGVPIVSNSTNNESMLALHKMRVKIIESINVWKHFFGNVLPISIPSSFRG